MTDTYQKSPRRPPLVQEPVPGPSGIAAKAVALREQKASLEQATRAAPSNLDTVTEHAPQGPSIRETLQHRPFGPVGNIAGAIAKVMASIGTIEKGGFNKFHNYHYARMEDLLVALTPLMGQNGIAVIQNEIEVKQIEGNRVAVTYEFSIFHQSGEFWPERPRFTGMSIARDSKGNWDDKAINKCHTHARKYFLLALFQVPAGDFDEGDADANQRSQQQPVPGPGSAPPEEAPAPAPPDPNKPHKIILGQGSGAEQWANAYIQAIGKAMTKEELKQWDGFNSAALQSLYDKYPDIYATLIAATERRLDELDRPSVRDPMPKDPGDALNWVAEQLMGFAVYDEAEQFWNAEVAPHEKDFDATDWGMLMNEWRRTELRLAPPDDEPEAV